MKMPGFFFGRAKIRSVSAMPSQPVADDPMPADHAAEVGKMRDPGLRAGHAEDELDDGIQGHKQPCRQGDGRDEEDDDAVGEAHAIGEQDPKHAAGCTHCWIDVAGHRRHQQLHGAGGEDAGEIQLEEQATPQQFFDFAAEHPQAVHIEEEVGEIAVQEGVGDELPRRKVGLQRPQGEAEDRALAPAYRQQEADYGDDKQDSDAACFSMHR